MPNAPGQGRKTKPKPNLKLVGGRGGEASKTNEVVSAPPPPDWLSGLAREKWEELAQLLAGTRVLTDMDLHNLEVFCTAYANWRDAEAEIAKKGLVIDTAFGPKKNPACTISRECQRSVASFGAALGLDPSSRARLGVPAGGSATANPFTGIVKPK